MPVSLGGTEAGRLYLGSTEFAQAYYGSVKIFDRTTPDPLNPLGLPAFTIRLVFNNPDGLYTQVYSADGTMVQISETPYVWDLTTNSSSWANLLDYYHNGFTADRRSGGTVFVRPTGVLGANSTGVTSMKQMFRNASISDIPLFDTSSVTDMSEMFSSNSGPTSIPAFNTANVTNMYRMFASCRSLTAIPLLDTGKVTNMEGICAACSGITTLPNFDTSRVTNMSSAFYGCTSLTTVPLFDTSRVANFQEAFRLCTSLTYVPLLSLYNAVRTESMFDGCRAVTGGALDLYNAASLHPPSYHSYMFKNTGADTTTGAAELAQIPSGWK